MDQENLVSRFKEISNIPVDPIFGMLELFQKDPRKEKVNLSAGILIEEDGTPARTFDSVRLAESKLLQENPSKIYLPIDGDKEYVDKTGQLIFGDLYTENIYGAATVGGTGALRILADFIKQEIGTSICLSNPTWANHIQIFQKVGFQVSFYPYGDFNKIKEHLLTLKEDTVVLLQPMNHNPTGLDLSFDEWKELSSLFLKRRLIPFFDTAYQGLGRGFEIDAEPIRHFIREGHECFIAHSYSKSMGLYNERVGALFVVMNDASLRSLLARNIRSIIRVSYSNPPHHGAHVAKILLGDSQIRPLWIKEVEVIQKRLASIRKNLAEKLEKALPGKSFDQIRKGNGFFTLLGLKEAEIKALEKEHAIYMAQGSRINIAAINPTNIDLIVNAIKKEIRE